MPYSHGKGVARPSSAMMTAIARRVSAYALSRAEVHADAAGFEGKVARLGWFYRAFQFVLVCSSPDPAGRAYTRLGIGRERTSRYFSDFGVTCRVHCTVWFGGGSNQ